MPLPIRPISLWNRHGYSSAPARIRGASGRLALKRLSISTSLSLPRPLFSTRISNSFPGPLPPLLGARLSMSLSIRGGLPLTSARPAASLLACSMISSAFLSARSIISTAFCSARSSRRSISFATRCRRCCICFCCCVAFASGLAFFSSAAKLSAPIRKITAKMTGITFFNISCSFLI